MPKIETLTLSQKIAEDIASKIVDGTLKPGERLIETDLTEQYGISRSPVREALYLLENQGIAERIPRKGVMVKRYTKKEIFDLYDTVYGIQEFVLKCGILTYTKEQLAKLKFIMAETEDAFNNQNFKSCFNLIEELQLNIFQLSKNTVIEDLYDRLNKQWTTFRYLTLSHPDSLIQSIQEYKEIIKGIEEKDVDLVLEKLNIKKYRGLAILEKIVRNM
jgi:DNA-binding GntR family transcriptional regulator